MKVLITGIDGFVGNYLANFLLEKNNEVYGTTILDDYQKDKVIVKKMNLLDSENVNKIIEEIKPDKIFHLAGQSAVGVSWEIPTVTINVNVNGTINILEAIRKNKLKTRILIVGSSDEYGRVTPKDCPVTEEKDLKPESPYGISKKTQEEISKLYEKVYNLDIVMVRPFNHIGVGQGKNFVVSDFASKISEIEKGECNILKVGNLEAYRDFTDVKDIVRGYDLLLEKGIKGEIYNIGSGKEIKIRTILDKLISMSTKEIKVEVDVEKLRPVDVPLIVCDNSKIKKDTGWVPVISIDETLKEILEYWRK